MEFPGYSFSIAVLYRVFGEHALLARALSILGSLVGLQADSEAGDFKFKLGGIIHHDLKLSLFGRGCVWYQHCTVSLSHIRSE